MAAKASKKSGIDVSVSFPGALLWPHIYSRPPRLPGLVEDVGSRNWQKMETYFRCI